MNKMNKKKSGKSQIEQKKNRKTTDQTTDTYTQREGIEKKNDTLVRNMSRRSDPPLESLLST